MKISKYLTAILTSILLIAYFTSCSDNKPSSDGDTVTTAVVTEAETDINIPDLPVVTYNGESLKILYTAPEVIYGEKYLTAAEMDGEVINDAIYKRNTDIEDKYGITLELTESKNPLNDSKKMIMAGENLDLVWMSMTECTSLAMQDYIINLAGAPYFDFTKPYWDSNAIEQLSIHGITYMAVNDISPSMLSGARFIFFNKYLIEQYNLSNPYELVNSNEWTIDNYISMVKSVSEDLNGDSKMDHNDRYGMLTEDCNLRFFLHGFGVRLTANNAEGELELSFMSDFTVTAFDKLRDFLLDKTVTLNYSDIQKTANTSGYDHVFAYARGALFAEDHFLFLQSGAAVIEESFRTMEHDFGIVPNPKYDSGQSFYLTMTDPNFAVMCIPATNGNLERTSIIVEDWAYQSSGTVMNAYYEITLKNKTTRDEESAQMMDIIKDSLMYEMSYAFSSISFAQIIDGSIKENSLVSTFAAKEESIRSNIEKLFESAN